jgi:hypothetical protein
MTEDTGAEHLRQQLVVLNQESRLRQRAISLQTEVWLFDDGASLGRRISPGTFDEGSRESQAILGPGTGHLPEPTGIGETDVGARAAGDDLADLEAEILEVRRKLRLVQDKGMRP